MMLSRTLVPVGTLVMALGIGGLSADAGQRDSRGRDRNGRQSQGHARERDDAQQPSAEQGGGPQVQAQRDNGQRGGAQAPLAAAAAVAPAAPAAPVARYDNRGQSRKVVPQQLGDERRGYGSHDYGSHDYDRNRNDRRDIDRYAGSRNNGYGARHYYGPGAGFSAYFGWGSGYLFGTTYSGRVYGYAAPQAYGAPIYYGDIRLQVRPRDAAVYVDGYYAGVVDNFDGVFQRLTLEVGPHQIELAGSGLEPRFFNVYVDPAHTVDIRSDLFR